MYIYLNILNMLKDRYVYILYPLWSAMSGGLVLFGCGVKNGVV